MNPLDVANADWDECKFASPMDSRGMLHGTYIEWGRSGNTLRKEGWVDDKKHGVSIEWYADGSLSEHTEYVGGKLHGPKYTWYANGKLRTVCFYEHDVISGEHMRIDVDGTKTTHHLIFDNAIYDMVYQPPMKEEDKFEMSLKYGITQWVDNDKISNIHRLHDYRTVSLY